MDIETRFWWHIGLNRVFTALWHIKTLEIVVVKCYEFYRWHRLSSNFGDRCSDIDIYLLRQCQQLYDICSSLSILKKGFQFEMSLLRANQVTLRHWNPIESSMMQFYMLSRIQTTIESKSQSWKHSSSRFCYNHFSSNIVEFLPEKQILYLTLKTRLFDGSTIRSVGAVRPSSM